MLSLVIVGYHMPSPYCWKIPEYTTIDSDSTKRKQPLVSWRPFHADRAICHPTLFGMFRIMQVVRLSKPHGFQNLAQLSHTKKPNPLNILPMRIRSMSISLLAVRDALRGPIPLTESSWLTGEAGSTSSNFTSVGDLKDFSCWRNAFIDFCSLIPYSFCRVLSEDWSVVAWTGQESNTFSSRMLLSYEGLKELNGSLQGSSKSVNSKRRF